MTKLEQLQAIYDKTEYSVNDSLKNKEKVFRARDKAYYDFLSACDSDTDAYKYIYQAISDIYNNAYETYHISKYVKNNASEALKAHIKELAKNAD